MKHAGGKAQGQLGFDDGRDVESTRAMLDQLILDSRFYTQSQDYKDLLDFVIRLPKPSPYIQGIDGEGGGVLLNPVL
jgi:hypothetical protein